MYVRGIIRPRKGSPVTTVTGSIPSAPGVTDAGQPQVNLFVYGHDALESKHLLANVTLSVKEARALASRIERDAEEAERQAEKRK